MPIIYGQVNGRAHRDVQTAAIPRRLRERPRGASKDGRPGDVAVDGQYYFPSIAAAAKGVGMTSFVISKALKDGKPREGHIFTYVPHPEI